MTYLKVKVDNDQVLTIRDDISDSTEYMHPAFQRAKEILREIVKKSQGFMENGKNIMSEGLYGYSGNILAISGRRGQGKTSTMLSLSRAMQKGELQSKEGIENVQFVPLDPIDPTVLESQQDPLMLVLSRMYQKAQQAWDESIGKPGSKIRSEDNRNKLMNLFQECLSGINAIKHQSKEEQPSLSEIHKLSDSARLKYNFYQLTESLLDFYKKEHDGKNGYMVILLDDTDFQIERSYEIMEDIRRYLTIPNVIILMATDLEILYDVIAQHFFDKMNIAITHKIITCRELRNHTHKYLDKLIPPNHIVNLPQMDLTMISDPGSLQLKFEGVSKKVQENVEGLPLYMAVYKLLYQKTGIMLLEEETAKAFIPTTLRGLMQLINLLLSMKDIDPEDQHVPDNIQGILESLKQQAQIRRKNLEYFENYFESSWVNSKFTNGRQASGAKTEIMSDLVRNLLRKISVMPMEQRYKLIIQELSNIFKGKNNEEGNDDKDEQNQTNEMQECKKQDDKKGTNINLDYEEFCCNLSMFSSDYPFPRDRCLLKTIEIWLNIIWQKETAQKIENEIEIKEKNHDLTVVIDFKPKELGLPVPYYGPIVNSLDENIDPILSVIKESETNRFEEINDTLSNNGEFYLMNFVLLFLKGNELPGLFSAEDPKVIYQAQRMAVRIGTNPEVYKKLLDTELEVKHNGEKAADYLDNILNEVGAVDRKIYSVQDKETGWLKEQDLGVINKIWESAKDNGSKENEEGMSSTLLRDWFKALDEYSLKDKTDREKVDEASASTIKEILTNSEGLDESKQTDVTAKR